MATKQSDERRFDTGDVIVTRSEGNLEVLSVQYQEDEQGNKFGFIYTMRHQGDPLPVPVGQTSQPAEPEER